LTTYSASIDPLAVSTPLTRLPSCRIRSTAVFSKICTPRWRAPRANDIVVSVAAAASGGATNATIVLLPYLASRDVAIGRGENAREKVTYTNIVRDIVPIAEWSGSAITRTIPLNRYKDFDGVAVLLQAGSPENPGAILGAARVALGSKP